MGFVLLILLLFTLAMIGEAVKVSLEAVRRDREKRDRAARRGF